MKKRKIDLNDISISLSTSFALDTRICANDSVEGNHENTRQFAGEIRLISEDDDVEIGGFNMFFITGNESQILKALEEECIEGMDIYNEFVDDEDKFNEIYCETFGICRLLVMQMIEIKEEYRGNGIIKHIINNIDRIFNCPIVLYPFPLQHSIKDMTNNKDCVVKRDLKKVKTAYKKCGFNDFVKKSTIMVKIPEFAY